eukprot:m51a1_g8659 hypothetical protein (1144) ;mRNA; f:71113-79013
MDRQLALVLLCTAVVQGSYSKEATWPKPQRLDNITHSGNGYLLLPGNDTSPGAIYDAATSAPAGDVDGDRVPDIVLAGHGAIHVLLGPVSRHTLLASSVDDGTAHRIVAPLCTDAVHVSVGSAGDLNGDGLGDVVVVCGGSEGYVLFGRSRTAAWPRDTSSLGRSTSSLVLAGAGASAVGIGDVNGDNCTDLAVVLAYRSVADPATHRKMFRRDSLQRLVKRKSGSLPSSPTGLSRSPASLDVPDLQFVVVPAANAPPPAPTEPVASAIPAELKSHSLNAISSSAVALEESLVCTIRTLESVYVRPLMDAAGEDESALAAVRGAFGGLKPLLEVSTAALAALKSSQATWAALALCGSYVQAYQKWLLSNADGFARVLSLKKAPATTAAVLQQIEAQQAAQAAPAVLEDLLWMTVLRIKCVYQVVRSQRDLVCALEAARLAGISAKILLSPTRTVDGDVPPTVIKAETLDQVDLAIDKIAELAKEAARIELSYQAFDLIRSFRVGEGVVIPMVPSRRIAEQREFMLYTNCEVLPFGLSVEIPVVVFVFTDAAAVCAIVPHSSVQDRERYELIGWYDLASIYVLDTQEKTKKPTFELGTRVGCPALVSISHSAQKTLRFLGTAESKRDFRLIHLAMLGGMSGSQRDDACWSKHPYMIIGADVESVMDHEEMLYGADQSCPMAISEIMHQIVKSSLHEEGLLRLVGSMKEVEELKQLVNTGKLDESRLCSSKAVNALTSLLKLFLREMPSPLIPADVQDEIEVMCSTPPDCRAMSLLLMRMPRRRYAVVNALFKFLATIAANEHINSMSPENLAIVVAPALCWSGNKSESSSIGDISRGKDFVSYTVSNYLDIFPAANAPKLQFATFLRKLIGHRAPVVSVDSTGEIRVWDLAKLRFSETISVSAAEGFPEGFECAAVASDHAWMGGKAGLVVASLSNGRSARITEAATHCIVALKDELWCGSDGRIVVVCRRAKKKCGELCVIESSARAVVQRVDLGTCSPVLSLAYIDGVVWAGCHEGEVVVFNSQTCAEVCRLERHLAPVVGIAHLRDQVWTCGRDRICIWERQSLRYAGSLRGYHSGSVCCVMPCASRSASAAGQPQPSTTNVWTADDSGGICVWSAASLPVQFGPPATFPAAPELPAQPEQ